MRVLIITVISSLISRGFKAPKFVLKWGVDLWPQAQKNHIKIYLEVVILIKSRENKLDEILNNYPKVWKQTIRNILC